MRNHSLRLLLAGCVAVFAMAVATVRPMVAQSCAVVKHAAPTDADKAYLAGDFEKAAELYKTALAASASQAEAQAGLIHSLLRQQHVEEAAGALAEMIGKGQPTAAQLSLRAEIELRQGEPWNASESAMASAKKDPCNPRTLMVLAKLANFDSKPATARALLAFAHKVDPEDHELQLAWIRSLPARQRIPELTRYLASPSGDDKFTRMALETELDQLKKWDALPPKACTLVTKPAATEIPFSSIRTVRGQLNSPDVMVDVNGHSMNLWLDTSYNPRLPIDDVSGLLILKSEADKMGLKPIFENMVPGVGPQGPRKGYVAYADSIKVGSVEFHDCVVQVMEGRFWNDGDGSISPSLFADYLVTLDFPGQKVKLDPLPAKPAGNALMAAGDRFIAPEMKDFTPVYRSGTDLFLPTYVNGKIPMLFLVDTATGLSAALSPAAGHQVVDGHRDAKYELHGMESFSTIDWTFSAGDVSLTFARMTKNVSRVSTFLMLPFTMDSGMEISGLVGHNTLHDMTIHIDYRDGLIKFDFDPKRTGAFAR